MKRFLFAAPVLLLAVSLLHADTPDVKPITVPFELLKTKHMVVMIKINGKGPYRVIFDTGAPVTLINNKVAKESGLLDKNARKPLFSLFGAMGQVSMKSLELGDLKAENIPTMVMDHPTVEAISKAPGFGPIEGIVGFPFFARYRLTLDYQAKEMTFVPSGFDPPDLLQTLAVTVTTMMQGKAQPPKILAPAGQWGLVVNKPSDDEDAGVDIKVVHPDSPAASAGLKVGDRLLTLDGRWTDSVNDCYTAASYVKPNRSAKVVVKRGEKELELTVKPRSGL